MHRTIVYSVFSLAHIGSCGPLEALWEVYIVIGYAYRYLNCETKKGDRNSEASNVRFPAKVTMSFLTTRTKSKNECKESDELVFPVRLAQVFRIQRCTCCFGPGSNCVLCYASHIAVCTVCIHPLPYLYITTVHE